MTLRIGPRISTMVAAIVSGFVCSSEVLIRTIRCPKHGLYQVLLRADAGVNSEVTNGPPLEGVE
jgi:hypothetical protein